MLEFAHVLPTSQHCYLATRVPSEDYLHKLLLVHVRFGSLSATNSPLFAYSMYVDNPIFEVKEDVRAGAGQTGNAKGLAETHDVLEDARNVFAGNTTSSYQYHINTAWLSTLSEDTINMTQ